MISAVLVTRVVFGCPSIYQLFLQNRGLDIHSDPLAQSLQRIGIVRAMDKRFVHTARSAPRQDAERLLHGSPTWMLVSDQGEPAALLPAADLALYLQDNPEEDEIDLMEIPAKRQDLARADVLASLKEALELLNDSGKEALYVTGSRRTGHVYGVLTRDEIERTYRA